MSNAIASAPFTEWMQGLSDQIAWLLSYVSEHSIELLKIFAAEYLLGYLLQSAIAVLCIYAFNKKKVRAGTYLWVTVVFAVVMIVFRQLPINFGVHTLFSLLILILVGVYALETNILYTIYAALTVTFSVIVFELITTLAIAMIVGKDQIESVLSDSFTKAAAVIPSNIVFFIIIFILYKQRTKGVKEKYSGKAGQ